MSNDSTHKAAALRKVAEALRAWGEFKGADSPEAREAQRTAIELAVCYLGIMMTSSNYGCSISAEYPLAWIQRGASERRLLDFEKCNHYWWELTQPRDTGGVAKLGFPDELERWADELEKAEDVLALTREAADIPGSTGGVALSKEARALAALADHPDWTDKQIAEAARCNAKSLYRMRNFKIAKAAIKQGKGDILRGSKSKKGEVEAWKLGEGPDDGGSLDTQYK